MEERMKIQQDILNNLLKNKGGIKNTANYKAGGPQRVQVDFTVEDSLDPRALSEVSAAAPIQTAEFGSG